MNVELIECYNVLGLGPGASFEELKAAHRDLTKVWHPDRFLHDPRLQQKAQEKLKEINEAYDQLRSGKTKQQTPPPSSAREHHPRAHSQTVNAGMAQRIRWRLILAPVLIFAVAFLVASRLLLRQGERDDQSQIPAFRQTQNAGEQPQSASGVMNSANELPRGKDRTEAKSQREEFGDTSTSQPSAASLPKMPTVTIVIDPTTGMIARSNCPVKTTMTYPSGSEPHQYCNAHSAAASYEAPRPGELRIKSAVKRLASPGKWFSGKTKSEAGNKQDTKSP
jgi:hypothetical protein